MKKILDDHPQVSCDEPEDTWVKIEQLKVSTGVANANPAAQNWWSDFQDGHIERPSVLLMFLTELKERGATLSEYWLVTTYSFENDAKSNLDYLDQVKRRVGKSRELNHTDFLDYESKPLRLN